KILDNGPVPTAQISLAERAEIPVSPLMLPLVGAATGTTTHLVPVQCSISRPLVELFSPTAQTLLEASAAIAVRVAYAGEPDCGSEMVGLGTIFQAEPFQCSITGWITRG